MPEKTWLRSLSVFLYVLFAFSFAFIIACGDDDDDSDSTSADDDDAVDDDDATDGCGKDPSGIALSLEVGDQIRTFELYVPAEYDPGQAYPLIFAWHGGGGTGAEVQAWFVLDEAVGSDAVVVYPDGLEEYAGGDTSWDLDPEGYDYAFFDELLLHLKANLCIDETRIFSTGWSMGGYMSNSLGCWRADEIAAIGSCSGGPARPKGEEDPFYWGECNGQVAAMVMHGTSDPVIPLAEGEGARDVFLDVNGCDETNSSVDPAPCVAYDGCVEPVQWCEFAGGHDWPGFAGEGIWNFFSAQ